jgi:hypothetical protein
VFPELAGARSASWVHARYIWIRARRLKRGITGSFSAFHSLSPDGSLEASLLVVKRSVKHGDVQVSKPAKRRTEISFR